MFKFFIKAFFVSSGDHIVPNFEEIWPSGKRKGNKMRMSDGSGVEHVMQAMEEGLPGCRDKTFTTCGKPKVPIESACFSSNTAT